MTSTLSLNGDTSAPERQAAARDAYRASVLEGEPVTGAELGRRFDRSPRWGLDRIAEVHAERAAGDDPHADVPDQHADAAHDAPASSPAVRRVTTLAVLAVALVAAVASYDHQRMLAEMAGEGWRSWLLPLSVDGLVIAASMSMLVRRRAGLPAGALAWCALLLGVGASLSANVAAAEPTVVGRLVAAWPPVALLLAYELAMQQVRARSE
jgi:hypothetical protein